jgi:hypothetical protein
MPQLSKTWSALFALLCLGLAAADYTEFRGHHVSSTVLGLIALATAPWSLKWFADMVQTLKVGGMQIEFRQQIERVEAKVAALDDQGKQHAETVAEVASAIRALASEAWAMFPWSVRRCRKGAAFRSPVHPTRARPLAKEAVAPPPELKDGNKNRFGGKPVSDGRKLSARVKPFPGSSELFAIRALVESTDPATNPLIEGTPVILHLHPSFRQNEIQKPVKNGAATVECVSLGAFTIGAEVEDVRLDLDLARDVPGAPVAFTSRELSPV